MTEQSSATHAGPPDFANARNRRQRARAAGMHPDYWYAVEFDSAVKPGDIKEVVFWKQSIALFRTQTGDLRALANRCTHRQLKLTHGEVKGCQVVCPYHGWTYDPDGRLAHIPHEMYGHELPKMKVPSYAVKVRYGLIWIFPGDPEKASERDVPDIPELEGMDRWACVPFDVTWKAHHSMIMDNVCDFSHEYLHRKYRPFKDARLTRLDREGDKVYVSYDTKVGRGGWSQHFVDHDGVDTNHMDLCYEYPYQWSNTGGDIRHWMFVLPIDEQTTRGFFMFHFKGFKIPKTALTLPRWAMLPIIRIANKLVFDPLLAEDGFAVEAEQDAWNRHWDMPIAELSPAVKEMQDLTIQKWEEHLAESGGRVMRKGAARAGAS